MSDLLAALVPNPATPAPAPTDGGGNDGTEHLPISKRSKRILSEAADLPFDDVG